MNYKCIGNANNPLIIFINGAGTGPWIWKNVTPYLLDFKIVLFDLHGHGENADTEFTTIEAMSKDIIEIIRNESHNNQAFLIGLSIGAQIIAHMLKSYNPYISQALIISCLNKKNDFLTKLAKPSVHLAFPLIQYRWFAKAQSKTLNLPEEFFENYYDDSLKMSKNTLSNVLIENQSFQLNDVLPVTSKVEILIGANEIKIMKQSAKQLAYILKKNYYYEFQNCGHGIPYENPKSLSEIIVSIINNQPIKESEIYNCIRCSNK